MITLYHPWQYGPSELIKHAIEHMNKASDFDRRIAFLLFDVGVETLLKTFLTLPDTVTHTKTKFQERKIAAEGNFHTVVDGVRKAANPSNLSGINLAEIEFYHSKRNTLYHDGNGITVSPELTEEYAVVAVNLLKNLLDVDLSSELELPKQLESTKKKKTEQILEMNNKLDSVNKAIDTLFDDYTLLVAECLAPKVTLPKFKKSIKDIEDKYIESHIYVDDNGQEVSISHLKYPDRYLSTLLDLTKTAIENDELRKLLFESKEETNFVKELKLLIGVSNFLGYEELIVTFVKHGTNEQLGWSREGWIIPLDYLTNPNFEDDDTRYEAFTQDVEKTLQDIQSKQEECKHWLNRFSQSY